MKPRSSNKRTNSRKGGEQAFGNKHQKIGVGKQAYSRLRKLGLLLSAISGAFLTVPIAMHPVLTTIATMLATIGGLMVSVVKIMTDTSDKRDNSDSAGAEPAATLHQTMWIKSH